MTEHATGYLISHPLNVASLASTKRWPMELLMEGRPTLAVPDEYLDPSIGPVALDQDNVGACVAYAAETIKQAQDKDDWGAYLYDSASAMLAYRWLKGGHGSFPGDGIPNSEGSYPEAVWKLALTEGLPDTQGRTHKITAYYSHNLASEADDAFVEQVILAYGPVNVGIPWYWSPDPLPPEYQVIWGGVNGAHSITIAGWKRYDGVRWWTGVNSWGPDWSNAQGIFRFRASDLHAVPLGPQIVWKVVDMPDAPAPIGGEMLPVKDTIPRLVSIPVGTQFYSIIDNKPVVKLGGTVPARVNSVCALSDTQYAVRISTGGVPQLLRVNKADVTVIASSPIA